MSSSGDGDGQESSKSDKEALIKQRAEKRKLALKKKYNKSEVAESLQKLEDEMTALSLDEAEKEKLRLLLSKQEAEAQIDLSIRMSTDHFEQLALIGRGAFGEVRLVRKKDRSCTDIYAMKSMVKDHMIKKNQLGHVRAERDILTASENPWIVTLFYSFQDERNLYMVMEYLPGGDFMGLLKKQDTLTEAATKQFAAELVMAIGSVHSLGYIHRDLKPDNILLDWDGHLKLTDLGLCKKVQDTEDEDEEEAWNLEEGDMDEEGGGGGGGADLVEPSVVSGARSLSAIAEGGAEADSSESVRAPAVKPTHRLAYSTVGSPDYIAPEVILKTGYGMDCDWWSLGILVFECLVGHAPFYDKTPVGTCRKILCWRTSLSIPESVIEAVSPECIDFIRSLITAAADRLGRHGVEEIKAHPWFADIEWSTLRSKPAPFIPQGSMRMKKLMVELSQIDPSAPSYRSLVRAIVCNFDRFEDKKDVWGKGKEAGAAEEEKKQPKEFIGYTFKRKKDVLRHTLSAVSTPTPSSGGSTPYSPKSASSHSTDFGATVFPFVEIQAPSSEVGKALSIQSPK